MAERTPVKKWQVILSLIFSALGILYFTVQSLVLSISWLKDIISAQTDLSSAISLSIIIWGSILCGVLLLPNLLLSIYRLRDQPIPDWLDAGRPTFSKITMWLILAWPLLVLIGWWVAGSSKSAAFLLGPITVISVGLPILWIYNAVNWKLKSGSQYRKWHVFGFSLVVSPVLIIVVELLAVLSLVLVGVVWVTFRMSVDPSLEQQLFHIYNRILLVENDLDAILQLLEPYLRQPVVIIWAVLIFGGIMPMIEEAIKPLALWFIADRKMTASEGFMGGMLCGAGFSLMENILYDSATFMPEDWLFMVVGRSGTCILHMLASGLVGWGLAKSWREGNWVFQGITLLAASLLHGLWNVLALFSGVVPLYMYDSGAAPWQAFLFYAPLILLLIISFISLFVIRRHFYKQQLSNEQGECLNEVTSEIC